MRKLRTQGLTLQAIGNKYGISRERVRQIVNNIQPVRKKKFKASHLNRRTCFICRETLTKPNRKFCDHCIIENKLGNGGKEITRGIVRGRDNNTCQVCGYKWNGTEKKRLDVHHLEGLCGKYSKSYDRPDRMHLLITVCHKCHYNLHDHRAYGNKKITN